MQKPLKSWDNVYTITNQVSYFPFQWEVYLLVCYLTDPATLWNEKVTRLANGFCILYDYLYIFVMNIWFEYGECWLTKISHHLQVLWLSYFIGSLNLEGNQLLLSDDWNGRLKRTKKGRGSVKVQCRRGEDHWRDVRILD